MDILGFVFLLDGRLFCFCRGFLVFIRGDCFCISLLFGKCDGFRRGRLGRRSGRAGTEVDRVAKGSRHIIAENLEIGYRCPLCGGINCVFIAKDCISLHRSPGVVIDLGISLDLIAAAYDGNLLHGLRVGTSRTILDGILIAHNRYIGQNVLFTILIQRVGITHGIHIGDSIAGIR